MSSYQEMVERIADIIDTNSEMGKSFILVGDNSSGKSDVLHRVMDLFRDKLKDLSIDDAVKVCKIIYSRALL